MFSGGGRDNSYVPWYGIERILTESTIKLYLCYRRFCLTVEACKCGSVSNQWVTIYITMNNIRNNLLTSIVLLVVLLSTVQALRCFKCDSQQDPRCGDPFNRTQYYESECHSSTPNTYVNNQKAYCKKLKERVGSSTVIERSCAFSSETDKSSICATSHNAEHCSICEHDGCNGAPSSTLPSLISCIAVPLFLATLLKN